MHNLLYQAGKFRLGPKPLISDHLIHQPLALVVIYVVT